MSMLGALFIATLIFLLFQIPLSFWLFVIPVALIIRLIFSEEFRIFLYIFLACIVFAFVIIAIGMWREGLLP